MGIERLKEALEANDWGGGGEDHGDEFDLDDLEDDGIEGDELDLGLGVDTEERKEEMKGMKQAIYSDAFGGEEGDDQDNDEVEKLQAMMLRMQAVRGRFLFRGIHIPSSFDSDFISRHGCRSTRSRAAEASCQNCE